MNSFWDVVRKSPILIIVVSLWILATLSIILLDPANIFMAYNFLGTFFGVIILVGGFRVLEASIAISKIKNRKETNEPDYFEFSDACIAGYSDGTHANYSWRLINHVLETKHYFILTYDHTEKLALPRRCFDDQEQLDSFFALLKGKVTKRRLHLKHLPVGITAPDRLEAVDPESADVK